MLLNLFKVTFSVASQATNNLSQCLLILVALYSAVKGREKGGGSRLLQGISVN